jgi:hypothetical protein
MKNTFLPEDNYDELKKQYDALHNQRMTMVSS